MNSVQGNRCRKKCMPLAAQSAQFPGSSYRTRRDLTEPQGSSLALCVLKACAD